MKIKVIIGCVTAGLLLSVAGTELFGQNGPGSQGRGYGGPPKSQEERAARQASCLQSNGGVCLNGGSRTNCPGPGMGQCNGGSRTNCPGPGMGQGNGNGAGQGRHGLRDGTGPRSANGTCPLNNAAQSQK